MLTFKDEHCRDVYPFASKLEVPRESCIPEVPLGTRIVKR